MNKFIRNNQKKILAIFSAFLMVMFILPSSSKNGRGAIGERTVGTLNGVKVSSSEMEAAKAEWAQLMRLEYREPNASMPVPIRFVDMELTLPFDMEVGQDMGLLQFFARQMSSSPAAEINRSPESFFLLLQAARDAGIAVSDNELDTVFANHVNLDASNEDSKDQWKPALRDFLMVRDYLRLMRNSVKNSQPRLALSVAGQEQSLAINVLMFSADDYLQSVGIPSEDDIKVQYAQYNTREPGQFEANGDDLGFGYKYHDRVKVQYLGLNHDDVLRAAKKSKSELEWYELAYGEFQKNHEQYDSEKVEVPATQPTTLPDALSLATTKPSTQPATVMAVKVLPDPAADFELHHELVLNRIYNAEANKLELTVLGKITDTMKADFSAWTDAQQPNSATSRPSSSVGPAYDTMDYIVALCDSIQKQFGVYPSKGEVNRFEGPGQLVGVEGIGKAGMLLNQRQPVLFSEYAMMVKGLKDGNSPIALLPWQVSQMLIGTDQSGYLFRVSAIDPSHVAPLDEVRGDVIRDIRLGKAYALAKTAASNALTLAKVSGLKAAAIASGRPQVTTTDMFNANEVYKSRTDASISPLKLNWQSAVILAIKSEALLIAEPPAAGRRPVSLVPLSPDAKVAVIELDQTTGSLLSKFDPIGFQSQQAFVMNQTDGLALARMLSVHDSLVERMNYKPEGK